MTAGICRCGAPASPTFEASGLCVACAHRITMAVAGRRDVPEDAYEWRLVGEIQRIEPAPRLGPTSTGELVACAFCSDCGGYGGVLDDTESMVECPTCCGTGRAQ